MIGIGKNRCQRVMNKHSIHPRKKHDGYIYHGKSNEVYPNLLLTEEIINYSDIYFSDLFEFRLVDGSEIHGCFVFRRSTRQVISLVFDYFEDASLVTRALQEGKGHIVTESMFHVDQGSVNGAKVTVQMAKDLGMAISMSRAGTPTDNPFAERFVRTFKLAVVYKKPYFTMGSFLEEALRWINFYNDLRPHEALKQISPNDYAIQNGIKAVSLNRVFRV